MQIKRHLLVLFLAASSLSVWGQKVGIKNNLLYDATLTPNLGIEIGIGKKSTLDISGGYNPFTFNGGRKFKHWLVQPEYRHWFCEKFNGTFWGIHLHGGEFNIGNLDLPFNLFKPLDNYRYDGFLLGGGLTLGHQWVLSKRWNLEAAIGAGYAYIDYGKYQCQKCGDKIKDDVTHYFGVTKAAISLIYLIK